MALKTTKENDLEAKPRVPHHEVKTQVDVFASPKRSSSVDEEAEDWSPIDQESGRW